MCTAIKHPVSDRVKPSFVIFDIGTLTLGADRLQLMHDNLHWLDVPERFKYKVIILTRRCLIGTAPRYLAACCRLCSGFRDGTETSSALRRWSCRRTV